MTIKIRPHHLSTFSKEALSYGTLDAFSRAKMNEIYGDKFGKHVENLLGRVNSGEDVEIIFGPDDICEKCCFNPHCSVGNYKPAKEAHDTYYDKYKIKVSDKARSEENNPANADSYCKEHHGLKEGQRLTKEELQNLRPTHSI